MIANQAGAAMWHWDNQEPFGSDLLNDDPGSTGNHFEFNLRFPGQYSRLAGALNLRTEISISTLTSLMASFKFSKLALE
jgi:hypothetical protein